jgi:hypothetical protein
MNRGDEDAIVRKRQESFAKRRRHVARRRLGPNVARRGHVRRAPGSLGGLPVLRVRLAGRGGRRGGGHDAMLRSRLKPHATICRGRRAAAGGLWGSWSSWSWGAACTRATLSGRHQNTMGSLRNSRFSFGWGGEPAACWPRRHAFLIWTRRPLFSIELLEELASQASAGRAPRRTGDGLGGTRRATSNRCNSVSLAGAGGTCLELWGGEGPAMGLRRA